MAERQARAHETGFGPTPAVPSSGDSATEGGTMQFGPFARAAARGGGCALREGAGEPKERVGGVWWAEGGGRGRLKVGARVPPGGGGRRRILPAGGPLAALPPVWGAGRGGKKPPPRRSGWAPAASA